MATSEKYDENETETAIDVSGFMCAFSQDVLEVDNDAGGDMSGDISMFCKACLHPYCGVQKAGTIVLRCGRCGQTDTVLEERVDSLIPQEWIGNLMMNRFMLVVKEQEDLSVNLTDPQFAADEYQNISLTLSEYTFNVEKIVVKMYAMARKARLATEADRKRIEACYYVDAPVGGIGEAQALNAMKTLIEIHRTLVMNEHVPEIDDDIPESNECIPENYESKPEMKQCVPKSDDQATAVENRLPNKVSLNADQGEDCRVDNKREDFENNLSITECSSYPSNDESKDKQSIYMENASDAVHEAHLTEAEKKIADAKLTLLIHEHLNGLGSTIQSLIERLILKYNLPDGIMINVEERLRHADKGPTAETSLARDNDSDNVDDQEEDTETSDELVTSDDKESRTIFNVPTTTIHNEVFGALWHKLRLGFHTEVLPRKLNLEQTDPDDNVNETQRTDVQNLDSKLECTDRNENSEATNVNSENDNHQSDEEGLYVNFYSLSSEFIRELGRRKFIALGERKDKALANIHEKLQNLKKEMERVEEAVTNELALAYARKMKKVAKQQKELDEKHAQVMEADRLLEYYSMTGQADKLAELMSKINIQFEN